MSCGLLGQFEDCLAPSVSVLHWLYLVDVFIYLFSSMSCEYKFNLHFIPLKAPLVL